jgi:hypothetical protein
MSTPQAAVACPAGADKSRFDSPSSLLFCLLFQASNPPNIKNPPVHAAQLSCDPSQYSFESFLGHGGFGLTILAKELFVDDSKEDPFCVVAFLFLFQTIFA